MESRKLPPPPDFDPADAELTDEEIKRLRPAREFFAEHGLAMPKPLGRPKAVRTKVPVTMRLDPDILDAYKATGPGWQTRMGEVLAQAIKKSA